METTSRAPEFSLLHTTFLAENPESFGQIPDARPLASDRWLIAAGGHPAGTGLYIPMLASETTEETDVMQGMFREDAAMEDAWRTARQHTFGTPQGRQEHTVARYSAVMTEAQALRLLADPLSDVLTGEILTDRLSHAIADGLDAFRRRLSTLSREASGSEEAFSVSFGGGRIRPIDASTYELDLFSAGDYGFYLLDEWGMAPLWLESSPRLFPVWRGAMSCHHLSLHHPGPFAVIMLSGGLIAPGEAERRGLAEFPGLLWCDRMRREEQLLRVITSAGREEAFGECAARVYTGQAIEHDSATGALSYQNGSYEELRALCHVRLRTIEDLIALLPDGYDEDHPEEEAPRMTMENEFVRYAFTSRPGLSERVMDRLSDWAMALLLRGEDIPSGENTEKRLTYADVHAIHRHYDRENDEDRRQIEANRRIIRDLLCEHWITLRPVLCPEEACDETEPAYAAACDRAYDTCCHMNARLTALLDKRQAVLSDLENLLSENLLVLRASGSDWLHGRGGDANGAAWLTRMTDHWPTALAAMAEGWQEGSETCRRLQAAYTAERENLFYRDIHPEQGLWRSTYEAIQNGRLPRGSWNLYAERTTEREDGHASEEYAELLLVLRTVSESTRVLLERIEERAVDRRTAYHIGGDETWQTACLQGILNGDPAWASCATAVVDESLHTEYAATVRRWEETRALISRRAAAFKSYYDMYTAYLPIET